MTTKRQPRSYNVAGGFAVTQDGRLTYLGETLPPEAMVTLRSDSIAGLIAGGFELASRSVPPPKAPPKLLRTRRVERDAEGRVAKIVDEG